MMILVGQLDSPFVRRVAATLTHYGMPFDRHVLSVFGDRDEVSRLNPLGKVPALIIDGDETLVESAVIVDYLDERVGAEIALTPNTGKPRRDVLRLSAIAMGLSERAVGLRVETVRRPPHQQAAEFVETHRNAIRSTLDFMEQSAQGPWMTGDQLTQADIAATASLTHLNGKIAEYKGLTQWPKLAKLRQAGEELDAFRQNPFIEG